MVQLQIKPLLMNLEKMGFKLSVSELNFPEAALKQ
jgi:hypothetical protein